LTEFDRAAIAAEIAEIVGTLPLRPAGCITIGEYADLQGVSWSTAARHLHSGVDREDLERLRVLEDGRQVWAFRVVT